MDKLIICLAIVLAAGLLFSCSGNKTPGDMTSSPKQIADTSKIQSELNEIERSFSTGIPDTGKLKKAAANIIRTDADILSDSGISKMYGDTTDPAVNIAKKTMFKLRNSVGLTPAKLDSIRKAASELDGGASGTR